MEKRAQWQFKTRLPIQDRMTEVIGLTMKASEAQLRKLRRKLERMQRGS